jgi:tetratricopeptide (TPR) repeat protein
VSTPKNNPDPDDAKLVKVSAFFDRADAMKSAEILFAEGLLEDGKRMLHTVLRHDPNYLPAKQLLREVQERELKQWLSTSPSPRSNRLPQVDQQTPPTSAEADSLLEKLDRDLGLGLLTSEPTHPDPVSGLSLFENTRDLEAYARSLDKELSSLSPKERMDIGIGFYEMGLYLIAERQFRAALRVADARSLADIRLGASFLLAETLLASNQPFEAARVLETIISDADLGSSDKIHFVYLLALAQEKTGKMDLAALCYHKILEVDPQYRDVRDRLKRVTAPA